MLVVWEHEQLCRLMDCGKHLSSVFWCCSALKFEFVGLEFKEVYYMTKQCAVCTRYRGKKGLNLLAKYKSSISS